VPPLAIQERIASILSAYDELIENNTRRIKILEEMAQMLYREWFVNFRFPGHRKVKMMESELGSIPEGWRVRNLFDVAHVSYGFPFKSKLFTVGGEGVPVIRIRDILSDASNTFTTESVDSKYIVKNGDLLVGMDGDFHMGKWAGGHAYLNQRVVRFRANGDLSPYFLFLALKAPINHFDSTIVGTTVAHLSDRDLRSISVLVPSDDILKRSSAILDPLFGLEIALKLKNTNLRTTRDLLLPKLISGEISVDAAGRCAAGGITLVDQHG
jgi:type I restriction enzyme S subunit